MTKNANQNTPKRIAGYCRTSGEAQRDNTSIPSQKQSIQEFCKKQGWQVIEHYVDESLSGAKTEKRLDFQRLMQDAHDQKFDLVVIHDLSRFARNGADIIASADLMKKNFGVFLCDTRGNFDNREHSKVLTNYTFAGLAEFERLQIMERTITARISNAKSGLPWLPPSKHPIGRTFEYTGKKQGYWYINNKGKQVAEIVERYVNGESIRKLCKEYGIGSYSTITRAIRHGQIADKYFATFNSPEIGIKDLRVPVPGIPPLISKDLAKRAKERCSHNSQWNKWEKRIYRLSGFVSCANCGRGLKGQRSRNNLYYRHDINYESNCPFKSIRGDLLEKHVLDYLFGFYFDELAYNQAIQNALPSDTDRKKIEKELKQAERQLSKTTKQINNLIEAVSNGADVDILIQKQQELKEAQITQKQRVNELRDKLETMPDPKAIKQQAAYLRAILVSETQQRDWRELSYDDIKQFLHHLFGDNPKKSGFGVFINRIGDSWEITFKGQINFNHKIKDGIRVSPADEKLTKTLSESIKSRLEADIRQIEQDHQTAINQTKNQNNASNPKLKPEVVHLSKSDASSFP